MSQFSNAQTSAEYIGIGALQASPKSYDFAVRTDAMTDGSRFQMNEDGRVIGALYSSGAAVKIHDHCMLVRGQDLSLWFADSNKRFHPLD